MTENVIRVEDLGKQYRIGQQIATYRTLRETLTGGLNLKKRIENNIMPESIWALDDV